MAKKSSKDALQRMCRKYLYSMLHLARKHGLGTFVADTIHANRRKECEATRHEVEILSRMCSDDRILHAEIPEILGKSYRRCFEDGDFQRIGKVKNRGTYSKVDAVLLAEKYGHGNKESRQEEDFGNS